MRESVRPTLPRQKYLHESRHQHAINRIRGQKGRFVNLAADENESTDADSFSSASSSSSPARVHRRMAHRSEQEDHGSMNADTHPFTRMIRRGQAAGTPVHARSPLASDASSVPYVAPTPAHNAFNNAPIIEATPVDNDSFLSTRSTRPASPGKS